MKRREINFYLLFEALDEIKKMNSGIDFDLLAEALKEYFYNEDIKKLAEFIK